MFHYLQQLKRSIARPPHRRQQRKSPVSCEVFETRLVLSAVTPLSAMEQPPIAADNTTTESFDFSVHPAGVLSKPSPPTSSAFDSAQSEFAAPNSNGTLDSAALATGGSFRPPIGDQPATSTDRPTLPPDALDAVFSQFNPANDAGHPGHRPRPHPPLAIATDENSIDDAFENSNSGSAQLAMADANMEPFSTTPHSEDNDFAETSPADSDGFVEIRRSTCTTSGQNDLLGDSLNSDDAADQSNLRALRSDSSRYEEEQTSDEDDSALQAALAFFNRQTDGGFVDARLDDLQSTTGVPGAKGATSLEAAIGRFNPFDDRSHTTMLAAVELRQVAETDTAGDGEHRGAVAAVAGVVLGTAGVRSSSLERLLRTFSRILGRLGSFILSDR